MPIYDYLCMRCDEEFEALRPMSERLTAECPSCGAEAKLQLSAPRISLDGTDPAFPGAYAQWPKKRKQKQQQEMKKSYHEPD